MAEPMTAQGIEAGTGETRSGSIRQDESPSPNGGAPDHPTATDWQNRAYRAEAECKELRERLEDLESTIEGLYYELQYGNERD